MEMHEGRDLVEMDIKGEGMYWFFHFCLFVIINESIESFEVSYHRRGKVHLHEDRTHKE